MDGKWTQTTDDYRVSEIGGQFQPEMFYQTKEDPIWAPLNADGFWAEPDAISTGVVTLQSLMTEEDAKRAVWKAQLINRAPV